MRRDMMTFPPSALGHDLVGGQLRANGRDGELARLRILGETPSLQRIEPLPVRQPRRRGRPAQATPRPRDTQPAILSKLCRQAPHLPDD
jgi:hypothetical protein